MRNLKSGRKFQLEPPNGKVERLYPNVRQKESEQTPPEVKQRLLVNIYLNGSKRAKKRVQRQIREQARSNQVIREVRSNAGGIHDSGDGSGEV